MKKLIMAFLAVLIGGTLYFRPEPFSNGNYRIFDENQECIGYMRKIDSMKIVLIYSTWTGTVRAIWKKILKIGTLKTQIKGRSAKNKQRREERRKSKGQTHLHIDKIVLWRGDILNIWRDTLAGHIRCPFGVLTSCNVKKMSSFF